MPLFASDNPDFDVDLGTAAYWDHVAEVFGVGPFETTNSSALVTVADCNGLPPPSGSVVLDWNAAGAGTRSGVLPGTSSPPTADTFFVTGLPADATETRVAARLAATGQMIGQYSLIVHANAVAMSVFLPAP